MKKNVFNALSNYFWIVHLATLAVSAYFLANGADELLAWEIRSELPVPKGSPVGGNKSGHSSRSGPERKAKSGLPILERNIFDSITGAIDPNAEPEEIVEIPEEEEDKERPLVPCDTGQFKLISTVVSEKNPEWSFATLTQGKEKMMYRTGAEVGDRVVRWIFWKTVILEGEDDFCYIDLFSDENRAPKKKGRRASRKPPRKPAKKDQSKSIKVISPTERIVDRQLVDKIMGNPVEFVKGIRFKPYRKNGKVEGFLLRRLDHRSPLALLGAKSGDIVRAINGNKLTSAEKSLEIYQKLRSTKELNFSITRRGKPLNLKIKIR